MNTEFTHDVLVVGAGAGGMTAAITASKLGLDVLVVEKSRWFGGTTALSGGVLWIPGTRHAQKPDSSDEVRRYMQREAGAHFDPKMMDAFLDAGPKMVEFLERETAVQFIPTLYPDYHPEFPGGADIGRSILAAPYKICGLGRDMARLRPPLATMTFMGMMFNSSNTELKHFFRATRSVRSALYVARRLLRHFKDLVLHGRGVEATSGNALAARLARSVLDAGVPIWTSTPALALITEGGRVVGADVRRDGETVRVRARKAVIVGCGGFAHDEKRTLALYPHLKRGGEHFSPVPKENRGDGIALAESVGGRFRALLPNAAAWMPTSKVPLRGGGFGAFPHLLDRYKPGVIGVLRNGQRFTNESNSYHDVGEAMIAACANGTETAMWLVCDQTAISKYGLGYAKPMPMPLSTLIRKGYLHKGSTLAALGASAGIDPAGLERTVENYNRGAQYGDDTQFGRGTTAFNRYLADPEQRPNPCVAPIRQGPFYAVKVVMGDLGTFDGLTTDIHGRVLDQDGTPVAGLYAVGNDRASVMGGSYPGAGITLGPIMTFGWLTARWIADSE